MDLISQIEQGIVHSQVRNLTQNYVNQLYITTEEQQTLVDASWVIVKIALSLYAKAAES